MASKLTVTTKSFARINKLLDKLPPLNRGRIFDTGLTRIVLHMQKEVTTSGDFIVHDRGDADPLPNVLTNRHGGAGLVGSIIPDYTGLPRLVSLGSDLPYAGVHEDSRRAYLLPTYDKMAREDKLADIMITVINEELLTV